ncbi:23S rRNA (pseudouridine(1915)-N(3))-methyltransferase RlmH [Lactovum miscens]|uniref:Ribosomal RNA large subunit methyltransferase H n=1 Tax=Lactovum miscens TaxID=190387 RepID=A0A841C8V5_9LACT|nr:23S rRNA (pseudouridine(1915)-N(3))-methyltransferase RlmH [Lactovum miscens]MBB5887829.1 23S rRNA (pseudouridine1915-N3)-methyltransferase [Lactovum miscens]
MKCKIIALGKLKEAYLRAGIEEYKKRMQAFGGLEIIELIDERIPENPSDKEILAIKNREGKKVLSIIKNDEKVIALTLDGMPLTSESLLEKMNEWVTYGASNITFLIGGSLGLSDEVQNRADLKLNFGRMTLPHQLMRLVLAEQIYRVNMINRGSTYHK